MVTKKNIYALTVFLIRVSQSFLKSKKKRLFQPVEEMTSVDKPTQCLFRVNFKWVVTFKKLIKIFSIKKSV